MSADLRLHPRAWRSDMPTPPSEVAALRLLCVAQDVRIGELQAEIARLSLELVVAHAAECHAEWERAAWILRMEQLTDEMRKG